jgi:DNA polymerase-3 subunit delta
MADATAARLHLFYGRDDFQLREAYSDLRKALDTDGLLATNTTALAGRGLKPAELIQHVTALPFLAEARVVVVENLISSLGGGQAIVRTWEPLLEILPDLPPTNHLVFLEPLTQERARNFSRSGLLGALREIEGADVRDFPELRAYARYNESESPVGAWARERSAKAGIEFQPDALTELVELVGANLWVLASEIDKLGQYAGARPVTREDVRVLTPEASEAGIFDVVDSVVEGRSAQALLLIRKMIEQGTDTPVRIQAMIARQVRHLVRATELLEQRADRSAVMEATGVRSKFPLDKLLRQAQSMSRAAAEQALREIERSDNDVKTGKISDVLALELLVMRLASLTQRRPAAAR